MSKRVIGKNPVLGAPYGENIQSLPRSMRTIGEGKVKVLIFDYGDMETRILAHYAAVALDEEQDVIYANAHRAKVVKFHPLKDEVTIRFNDKALIPPEMTVPVNSISYPYGHAVVNKAIKCPKCNVRWKESPGFRFSFFDCPTCGMRREDA